MHVVAPENTPCVGILTDVEPDMRVVCQEVFGPVLVVGTFEDFGEAIKATTAICSCRPSIPRKRSSRPCPYPLSPCT